MKRRTLAATVLAAALVLSIGAIAEEKKAEPKKQTNCPVMRSQPIDKDLHIDVKGKRIYVCCSGCINQVKANPDKYIKRLEDQGVVLETAPEKKTQPGKEET